MMDNLDDLEFDRAIKINEEEGYIEVSFYDNYPFRITRKAARRIGMAFLEAGDGE